MLPLDREHETLWASQAQIAELFEVNRSGVTKHVNDVVRNAEVDKASNVQISHIAAANRPVTFYSLDVILAVGYRANAGRAITLRRWASGVLKVHRRGCRHQQQAPRRTWVDRAACVACGQRTRHRGR